MTSYAELPPLVLTVYGAAGIALLIAAVVLVVNAFALRLGRRNAVACSAVTAAVLAAVQCLGEVSEAIKENVPPMPMGKFTGSLPAALVAAVLLAFAAAEAALTAGLIRQRRSMLTPDSIKECLDALPDGIGFAAADGRPLLTNTRLNSLSAELFGVTVMNNESCWRRLADGDLLPGALRVRAEPTPIVKTADGTVWDFRRSVSMPGLTGVIETVAYDVTEQYVLNRELEERNRALEGINGRLKKYSGEIERLTREKEILAAKVRVHDDVGRSLLVFRSYMAQPERTRDRREVLDLWRHNLAVMKNEAEPVPDKDDLTLLRAAAYAVDVRITAEGEFPRDGAVRPVIMGALHECLVNMVRHAGGDELKIVLRRDGGTLTAEITNNGSVPAEPIREKGGLANLRRSVELAGGRMEIESAPRFCLRLTFARGDG